MLIPDVGLALTWLKELMDSGVSADGVDYVPGWNFSICIRRETDGTCLVSLRSDTPMEEIPLVTFGSVFPYSSAELALALAEKIQRAYLGRISNIALMGFDDLLEEKPIGGSALVGGRVGEEAPGVGSNVVNLAEFRKGRGV